MRLLEQQNQAERGLYAQSLMGARRTGLGIEEGELGRAQAQYQYEDSKPKWYDYMLASLQSAGDFAGKVGGMG